MDSERARYSLALGVCCIPPCTHSSTDCPNVPQNPQSAIDSGDLPWVFLAVVLAGVVLFEIGRRWWQSNEWKRRRRAERRDDERDKF